MLDQRGIKFDCQ